MKTSGPATSAGALLLREIAASGAVVCILLHFLLVCERLRCIIQLLDPSVAQVHCPDLSQSRPSQNVQNGQNGQNGSRKLFEGANLQIVLEATSTQSSAVGILLRT